MAAQVVLSIRNLKKTYNQETVALRGVSFDVSKGNLVSVIGPSGAGKSTLFRCINRMIEADSGSSIMFNDEDILKVSRSKLKKARRSIGMVFQHYNLVYRLTALENVLHGRLGYYSTIKGVLSLYKDEDVEKAEDLLELLGLGDRKYFRCSNLSGGQKQRVGIARALIQDPKIILADEPIASLDPQSSKVIMDYLRNIVDEFNIPCLVNLHQVEVAINYSDRIIGVSNGEIVFQGPPSELTNEDIKNIYGAELDDILQK
ncbi:MAG: phosphonate ABC transporter ATP-binding protein [Clostridia bacterium]